MPEPRKAITGRTGVPPVHEEKKGGGTRGRGIPKGSRHVRNSVSSLLENFAKVRQSEIRRLRYVGKSHVACLLIMFCRRRLAMPSSRCENVRHATLLFCAEGVNVQTTWRGKKDVFMLMPILKSDEKMRRADIIRAASKDPEVGFLLTVFNLEWTLRRMVLCFSKCPSVVVRSVLKGCNGFWGYCDTWKLCVCSFDTKMHTMPEILGVLPKTTSKENFITQYIDRRHVLVHGVKGGIGVPTALCGISALLKVSENLVSFARIHGVELFKRLNPRQNVRCGFILRHGIEPFKIEQRDGLCPAKLREKCPMLASNDTRRNAKKLIFNNLRKTLQPVAELANVKGESLVEKVRKVAAELGLVNKAAIKRAICKLEKRCEEQKLNH